MGQIFLNQVTLFCFCVLEMKNKQGCRVRFKNFMSYGLPCVRTSHGFETNAEFFKISVIAASQKKKISN